MKRFVYRTATLLVAMICAIGLLRADELEGPRAAGPNSCANFPSHDALQYALASSVGVPGNGGLGFNMWASLVAGRWRCDWTDARSIVPGQHHLRHRTNRQRRAAEPIGDLEPERQRFRPPKLSESPESLHPAGSAAPINSSFSSCTATGLRSLPRERNGPPTWLVPRNRFQARPPGLCVSAARGTRNPGSFPPRSAAEAWRRTVAPGRGGMTAPRP